VASQAKDKTAITQESLVSMVKDEHKRREQDRMAYELVWKLNVAFIEGNQYVDADAACSALLEIPKMFIWQEREVFNQIAPIIETRIARLARLRPLLKARPGTNERSDIRAAKIGSAILKNIYYEQGIQSLMGEMYAWMEACGSVFVKNIWNPDTGPLVGMEKDEEGNVINIYEGDLDVIVCPAFEIYPDTNYRQTVDACRSIIHVKLYHIDEIKDIWGVEVEPEDTVATKLQRAMTGLSGLTGAMQFSSAKMKDYAAIKEYWERPCKQYPNGRLIVVCNDKLIHFGDMPYPLGKDGRPTYPFVKVDCIERPGVFWGRTIAERLIPLQRRYNALKNRKVEYLNRVAIGQWSIEKDSMEIADFEANAGAPGYINVRNPGTQPPVPIQSAQLPRMFSEEEIDILQQFNALSGVSDLARLSEAEPGARSGVAMGIQLGQDDARLVSTVKNLETFLVDCGRQWLRLYKKYVSGSRTLKTVGKDSLVEVIDWTGADITSDDVVVEAFSSLLEPPEQRRQMVFNLMQSGLLHDENGKINKHMKSKILEIIELGNWESVDDDEQLHVSKAHRENLKLSGGQTVMPDYFDDHVRHIYNHNNNRLTVDYEELRLQFPQVDQFYEAHVSAHLEMMGPEVDQAVGMEQLPPEQPIITGENAVMAPPETGGII